MLEPPQFLADEKYFCGILECDHHYAKRLINELISEPTSVRQTIVFYVRFLYVCIQAHHTSQQ